MQTRTRDFSLIFLLDGNMNNTIYSQFDQEIDNLDLSVFDNASADFEDQFKLDYVFT